MKNRKNIKMADILTVCLLMLASYLANASSHREAPMISNDPLADNCDVYAFRSPGNPNKVTLIATYVPMQFAHGGPNYYSFGENIRYEIHVDNNVATPGDDITYRFTFNKTNQDPTTFFNIRLGAENLKTTYTLEKSTNGGVSWTTIITNGIVPPPNIGARSIEGGAGLNAASYTLRFNNAIKTASSGEQVFCGSADDPFFVDLGGVFDLGDLPRKSGGAKDGLKFLNVSVIAIEVDIAALQKNGQAVSAATSILDPNYVIGVWASASRRQIRTLHTNGTTTYAGSWVQVSRLGMPLTNEAVIPIGKKDLWNSITPYQDLAYLDTFKNYFYNPELALYMDDSQFGSAIPGFAPLRIQRNSLQAFDFGNGHNGLYGLKGSAAVAGTALDDAIFGTLLLPAPGSPRSVDLWPIFHTGVPNLAPYHLATGKGGNPLANGKPFINNFLPNGGDMLRLNMAVPVTPRNSAAFSADGLINAAVLGLTNPAYNSNSSLQFIPNMDGFPNGRRLEDDVTKIELQAVGGAVLAAIGLWYDDYVAGSPNPVTTDLLDVLTYSTGVNHNDTSFRVKFPFVQIPWRGTGEAGGLAVAFNQSTCLGNSSSPSVSSSKRFARNSMGDSEFSIYPNPVNDVLHIDMNALSSSKVSIRVVDIAGRLIKEVYETSQAGENQYILNLSDVKAGIYVIQVLENNQQRITQRFTKKINLIQKVNLSKNTKHNPKACKIYFLQAFDYNEFSIIFVCSSNYLFDQAINDLNFTFSYTDYAFYDTGDTLYAMNYTISEMNFTCLEADLTSYETNYTLSEMNYTYLDTNLICLFTGI